MDEDHILREIRNLTVNDDLPINVVLRKIAVMVSNYIQIDDEITSKNRGIISGNILSLLISKGVTYATHSESSNIKYPITERRVGILPSEDLYFVLFTSERECNAYLVSEYSYVLVHNINVDDFVKEMVSDFDIKHGMLYCKETSKGGYLQLYIIPSRRHIMFKEDGLYVQIWKSSHMKIPLPLKGVSALPLHVLNWLYP